MRSMATCSVRYSKSKVRGQKHPMEVVKIRNIIPNISYVFFQHTEIVPWLTVMMRYYVTLACSLTVESHNLNHGPLAKYVKLRVRMRRECRERFPRQITSPYCFHIFQWIWWLCILFHMNSGFLEPVHDKRVSPFNCFTYKMKPTHLCIWNWRSLRICVCLFVCTCLCQWHRTLKYI